MSSGTGTRLVFWFVIGVLVWLFVPTDIERKLWYSTVCNVDYDNVRIEDEPTDCSFWRSPLGLKGCHYNRVVHSFLVRTSRVTQLPLPTTVCDPNDTIFTAGGSQWMWSPQGSICLGPTVPAERVTTIINSGYSPVSPAVVQDSITRGYVYVDPGKSVTESSEDGGKTWIPYSGDDRRSIVVSTWEKVSE